MGLGGGKGGRAAAPAVELWAGGGRRGGGAGGDGFGGDASSVTISDDTPDSAWCIPCDRETLCNA